VRQGLERRVRIQELLLERVQEGNSEACVLALRELLTARHEGFNIEAPGAKLSEASLEEQRTRAEVAEASLRAERLIVFSLDASTDCEGLTVAGIDASTQHSEAVPGCDRPLVAGFACNLHSAAVRADAADCEGLTVAGIESGQLVTYSGEPTLIEECSDYTVCLDLGDYDLKEYEWLDYPIVTHLVRDNVIEYYDTWSQAKCVLASAPVGSWGGASFAVRTAVRMHHAMASGLAEDVAESGPRAPCPHDTVTCTNTPLHSGLGDAEFVDSLEADEGGVFTYMVTFEHGTQAVRCGHDLQGYPQSMRREIRYFWKEAVNCPTAPHYLGSMARVFTTTSS
jgi:hypothetical protein